MFNPIIIPIQPLYVHSSKSLHYVIWAVPSKTANTIKKRHNETGWRNWCHSKVCDWSLFLYLFAQWRHNWKIRHLEGKLLSYLVAETDLLWRHNWKLRQGEAY
jgi:hypothetical protein